ncbi:uncharacterized protein LOC102801086 [Saccoglossus kowalevskii]|uniref:Uncharacterized protein LOC102801086 n=1 Tax=Saccoglossus kowalevskii TaxID=10224 RepID=A0ABM0MED7_SACKO|nr:PREDICTED: uncharacterized protein LOC102801086 [Saccoglossus kowalevskii]
MENSTSSRKTGQEENTGTRNKNDEQKPDARRVGDPVSTLGKTQDMADKQKPKSADQGKDTRSGRHPGARRKVYKEDRTGRVLTAQKIPTHQDKEARHAWDTGPRTKAHKEDQQLLPSLNTKEKAKIIPARHGPGHVFGQQTETRRMTLNNRTEITEYSK